MESLSRVASSIASALSEGRSPKSQGDLHELTYYRSAYKVVESLVADFGEMVENLPPDLEYLQTDAERILRRFEIRHPSSEDDVRGALAWMHYYGDATDLNIIRAARPSLLRVYPSTKDRVDGTVRAIVQRSRRITLARIRSSLVYFPLWFLVAVPICWLTLAVLVRHFVSEKICILLIGLTCGFYSCLFLLRRGFLRRNGPLYRLCLIAAGIVMLFEILGLLEALL